MQTPEAAESWQSIPVNSFVDAGKHGLFLKLTEDAFIPMKVDKRNRIIGYGTLINASEFPEVAIGHKIATMPERHALPTSRSELTGAVGGLVSNLFQRARNCLTRKK